MEDITGMPFTQSRGVSDSYRWFAPELCCFPGVISTRSDVFAFAMTALEVCLIPTNTGACTSCSQPFHIRFSQVITPSYTSNAPRRSLSACRRENVHAARMHPKSLNVASTIRCGNCSCSAGTKRRRSDQASSRFYKCFH